MCLHMLIDILLIEGLLTILKNHFLKKLKSFFQVLSYMNKETC